MKRHTFLLLISIIISIAAGCSNSNNSETAASETKQTNEKAKETAEAVKTQTVKTSSLEEVLSCKKDDPEDQVNKLPQDTGFEDPFTAVNQNQGTVKIGPENFKFNFLEDIAYERTGATLIDASDHLYLFHNHNNVLSYYDSRTKKKLVLDEHINQAMITPDEQYIIYTKNAIDREAFYYVDTEVGQKKEFHIFAHDKRMKISDLAYKNGLVYFSFQEDGSTESTIKMAALPSYTDHITAAEEDSFISNANHKLFESNNEVYFYNEKNSSLDISSVNKNSDSLLEVRGEEIKELLGFDYFNKNKWALGVINHQDEQVILTPEKKVNCYEAAMKTALFDDHYLLVNDNLSLYLLDLNTNESSLMKSGISDFFVAKNRIIIQTGNGEFIELSNDQELEEQSTTKQETAKQETSNAIKSEESNKESYTNQQTAKETGNVKTLKEQKEDQSKLADSITKDDVEDFASQGDIYRVQPKGASKVILEHNDLAYQFEMDADVFDKLIIEENAQNGIISTGFYYETQDIQAFIFSIDNYSSTAWDAYGGIVPNEILGQTPIRVLTYAKPQENPFPPSSKESEDFLQLVEKVSSYVETFRFVE